jgi:hypothetical protein
MKDAVGVDAESNQHAPHSRTHRRDAGELEIRERSAIGRHLALALHDMEVHPRLFVRVGGELLAGGRGDRLVAMKDLLHRAAHGLDAERQWSTSSRHIGAT